MSVSVRNIRRGILFLCALFAAVCCGLPEIPADSEEVRGKGMPVCLTAIYEPGGMVTKAGGGKTAFSDGDVIHVSAEFYAGDISQGASGEKIGKTQYCAYMFNGGDWTGIMQDGGITWPYSCDYGVFTAYYAAQANGAISSEDGATDMWSLSGTVASGLTDDTGPMKAGATALAFGHVVRLVFSHMCTRLSVIRLDAATAGEYWLSKPSDPQFHNAFRLVRNPETGVEVEWTSLEDEQYGTYISRYPDTAVPSEYGNAVTFYLEPGARYSGIKLNYRYNRNYLTLSSEKLNGLKANCSYVLDITQDKGVVFEDPDDGGWSDPDKPENAFKLDNIPAFLEAAGNGQEYQEGGMAILEHTNTGVILLVDLDFGGKDPLSEADFPDSFMRSLQNLGTTVTFDGNFKYIHNSVRPVFNEVQGRLYNLGISNTVREGKISSDVSGYGGLSRSVSASGTIGNVRISNLSLSLELPLTENADVYYIGCVAGLNNGIVSGIGVRGDINIQIKDADAQAGTRSEVLVGGIIGQNAGTLSDCSAFVHGDADVLATCVTVRNTCRNVLPMSSGGVVGYSHNNVENVILKVDVDASGSTASNNFTGGMAGRLRRSEGIEETRYFKNISVEGRVRGGQAVTVSGVRGKSFTGGVAGRLYNFFISNCNSLCEVSGWNGEAGEGVRYATGGAFGCIASQEAMPLVFDSTWWGASLEGLSATEECYIGTFAGIIPTHRTENGYLENGNRAREVPGIGFWGGQLDDETVGGGIASAADDDR
jgi:hypothetical protein